MSELTIMKKQFSCLPGLLCLALCALAPTGCSKNSKPAPNDEHVGHNHGSGAPHAEARPGWCSEHNLPEPQCGICNPGNVAALKPGESVQVRLPSAESARMAGIETAPPSTGGAVEVVECYAEIAFNQNRLAQLTTPVGGIIHEVVADLGNRVTENQVVARIWSAEIAAAVAKAVLAHQTLDRERRLRDQRITPERDFQEAEATHRAACQQLRTLGFSEEQIDELGSNPQDRVLLEVAAPFAGEIIERSAVRGALIETGKPLFTLADREIMWAMLNIPESSLASVRVGQTVELDVDSLPGRKFTGRLTWVSAEVDERTRMARARAEVANPDGVLRARMFARARILARQTDRALLVPASAVQQLDGKALVFVKRAEDLFEARAVRLGSRHDGQWEIAGGLKPDDLVAVQHGFALKSQLLLSRLGAGCADD